MSHQIAAQTTKQLNHTKPVTTGYEFGQIIKGFISNPCLKKLAWSQAKQYCKANFKLHDYVYFCRLTQAYYNLTKLQETLGSVQIQYAIQELRNELNQYAEAS